MNRKFGAILGALVIFAFTGAWWYQHNDPAARGERDFHRLGCIGCHSTGPGPNLTHIVGRQDPKLLERFIQNPPAIYRERGMRSLNDGYMLMPDMHATDEEARDIVAYLETLNRKGK